MKWIFFMSGILNDSLIYYYPGKKVWDVREEKREILYLCDVNGII